jgi:SynChlorMet cassette radical SAM/SPASM protein ScmF
MNHSYNNMSDHAGKKSAPPLKQIYFYLTEGCNLACRHCWISPPFDPDGNKYSFLPLEAFETAIHEAKPLGLTGVKLTGGEPVMHPRFMEFLEVARRESLSIVVETNGMLCTPLVAKEIAKSPGSFVSVSLDGGDAETHEWVRGIEGSFSKALNGVRNLVDAGIDPQIIMTVMRHNVDQIGNLITMAEKLGASSVKFNIVQPTARGEKLNGALTVEELVRVGRYVETKLAPETALKIFFDLPMAFRSLSRIATGDGCGICSVLSILGVLPDGLYALCGIGKHVNELVFGKAGRDRLAELWFGNIMLENLRKGLPKRLEGICAECLMKGMCLGSCIAQNFYRTGSLWSPHWFCADAEKACIFPDTRRADKGAREHSLMKSRKYGNICL